MTSNRLPVKTLLTTGLSLLALARFVRQPEIPRLLCFAAMGFSSLGDFALMPVTPLGTRAKESHMERGALLFAIAHLFYASAALAAAYAHDAFSPWSGLMVWGLLLLLGTVSLLAAAARNGRPSVWAVMGGVLYVALLTLDVGTVWAYGISAGGFSVLAIVGALSFFLSDYLIGWRSFGGCDILKGQKGNCTIWFFYVAGQLLLVLFLV